MEKSHLGKTLSFAALTFSKKEKLLHSNILKPIKQTDPATQDTNDLEQTISILTFAINRAALGIYLLDSHANIKYVNDFPCSMLEYSRDELLGMKVMDFDPDTSVEDWEVMWSKLEEQKSFVLETVHLSRSGKKIPIEITTNYFFYNGQKYSVALAKDITERKNAEYAKREAERAIQEQEERFRQLAENSASVVWLMDIANQSLLYVSPAYETIWGKHQDTLYEDPKSWLDSIHPEDKKHVLSTLNNYQIDQPYKMDYRIIRQDKNIRYIHERAYPIQDTSGKLYRIVGTSEDITERKEYESRIQYIAYHDALTGLANRTLAMDHLNLAIAQADQHKHMLAVLFLDLDHFKTINDSLGHQTGDLLLKQVASRLLNTLRKEDTVGRVGGDEFLVIIPQLSSAETAAHIAEKMIQSLSSTFTIQEHELHISASIGIGIYPRDTSDTESLIKYADIALYHAKDHGRNTYRFFSSELDHRIHQYLQLQRELHRALNHQELVLHYQPLQDLASGRCVGMEALLRWHHPELGSISPEKFIPVAEETGLIIPIGDWVLRTACLQAKSWLDAGKKEFRMAVNLSRRQFDDINLAQKISDILRETDCPAHILELEMTESSSMHNPEQALATLNALHNMGIKLALDDYGTGYSSLAYLKRFPFDRLKIDRSFVNGIPHDNDDMTIVQTTIVMAKQLRLDVIAEGVETEEQKAFLKTHGCTEIQGFLFARPMPGKEVEKLL